MGKYKLIYADPPWSYKDKCHSGQRGAGYKYSTMSLLDLKALPVGDLADQDCLLAMWWVAPMPQEAIDLVKAWGFSLKTMKGFTWHKTSKHGKQFWGMGNYTRANSEDCLFAIKGKPKRVSAAVSQLIVAPFTRHSEKPNEARLRLERLIGDVPRIELFARSVASGWDAWGNEVDCSIEMPIGGSYGNQVDPAV